MLKNIDMHEVINPHLHSQQNFVQCEMEIRNQLVNQQRHLTKLIFTPVQLIAIKKKSAPNMKLMYLWQDMASKMYKNNQLNVNKKTEHVTKAGFITGLLDWIALNFTGVALKCMHVVTTLLPSHVLTRFWIVHKQVTIIL